jgi:hypothetical protein
LPTATVNPNDTDWLLWLEFPEDMDTGILPSVNGWHIIDQSTNFTGANARAWLSARRLQLTFIVGEMLDLPGTVDNVGIGTMPTTALGYVYSVIPQIALAAR